MAWRDKEDILRDMKEMLGVITGNYSETDKLVDLLEELIDHELSDLDDRINKVGKYDPYY